MGGGLKIDNMCKYFQILTNIVKHSPRMSVFNKITHNFKNGMSFFKILSTIGALSLFHEIVKNHGDYQSDLGFWVFL